MKLKVFKVFKLIGKGLNADRLITMFGHKIIDHLNLIF